MNKQELLKYIAIAGYDVGFGAKKHFATFDIIEKGPGWLGFVSMVGGIYGLFVPFWSLTHVSAVFVVFGVISLYIGMYGAEKQRYEDCGKKLTQGFHDLHALYRTVKSAPDGADVSAYVQQAQKIRADALTCCISKQIFLSDWYAHFKFFWQAQIDWIDEARPFRLLRDKIPLSAYLAVALLVVMGAVASMRVTCSLDAAASTATKEAVKQ
ncbi:SLATT domain-containing protein [Roseateles cavernae]|uniref:SLATT domain-containing protein n=1 Tax=Roseateles cavernae TaxID=3153578 RepID=UPI0032E3F3F0